MREDPQRKGLLYAGTENAAYVSFDEGDHWTSLQLNMPVTRVRDLVIHGDDLVAATYGRAFWILDDLTPLRQIDRKTVATSGAALPARKSPARPAGFESGHAHPAGYARGPESAERRHRRFLSQRRKPSQDVTTGHLR